MKQDFINLNGQRFRVSTWGAPANPTVLMLHGFPEFGAAWDEVARALPEWRCVALDQRGFGGSWAPEDLRNYDLRALVGDVAALIEQLGGPLPVIAHDWGAIVAYALAMWRPELLSHLVVINGVHPGPFQREVAKGAAQSEASAYIEYLRDPRAEERLARDNYAGLLGLFAAKMDMSWMTAQKRAEYVREWSRPGVLTGMLNWYRASPLRVAKPGAPLPDAHVLPPKAGHIPMPHMVIWGENDAALLPETLDGLGAYCADLTIATVPDADHWICHQKPDVVADTIRKWMTRTGQRNWHHAGA